MKAKDWDVIVNPLQLYDAYFMVDGDEVCETTTGSTLESATMLLQPGWKCPIKVTRIQEHNTP